MIEVALLGRMGGIIKVDNIQRYYFIFLKVCRILFTLLWLIYVAPT
jgi:hypothetical protein